MPEIVVNAAEADGSLGRGPTQSQDDAAEDPKCCSWKAWCSWMRFSGVTMAQGYAANNVARGAIISSNIFLQTSILFLANKEAGCVDDEDEIIDNCDGKVYGQTAAGLVANIATVTGILSAFLMPLFGAIIDYSNHRWTVGVAMAILITVIQGIQIYTVESTWWPMAILQAITGVFYQVEILSIYAYMPAVTRLVGQAVMTHFHAHFVMIQFSCQCLFLIVIIGLGIFLALDTVPLAQYSQAVNAVWIAIAFSTSWYLFPKVSAERVLPEGSRLWLAGFTQVGRTTAKIYREHKRSLFPFLLGIVFAESAINAYTTVSVIFLSEKVKMDGNQIGIFFLITLLMSLPGSKIGAWFTTRYDPNFSIRLCMFLITIVTIIGSFILKDGAVIPAYIWGMSIGIFIGWYYPAENVFFSTCLPKGQDTEMAGFFVYCTQILVWLPPLIFAALVDAGVDQSYGVLAVTCFFYVAIAVMSMLPPWEEILADVSKNDKELEVVEQGAAEGDKKYSERNPVANVEPTEELSYRN